jgi:hypothetical protein
MDSTTANMTGFDFVKGIFQLDEQVIDEVYKRYAADTIKFIKQNGGQYKEAGEVLAKSVKWIANHAEHHSKIKNCHFPTLLFNLVKVYWAIDYHANFAEQVDTFGGKIQTDCIYSIEEILEEVLIVDHFSDLHMDCKKVLIQCWSGNPFEKWKENLDTIPEEDFNTEKSKCIKAHYDSVTTDPLFGVESSRGPLQQSFVEYSTYKKMDDYWDEKLHGDELQKFVDKMDTDKAFYNAVQFVQVMRDIIRIPHDLISNEDKLNEIIAVKTDKYIRPEMVAPGPQIQCQVYTCPDRNSSGGYFSIATVLVSRLKILLWLQSKNRRQYHQSRLLYQTLSRFCADQVQ